MGRKLRALSLAGRRHFEAGSWSEANSIYREIVALCPDSGPAHCDLGITFVRLGRMTEAVAALQRAVELRPGHFNALVNLAYALELEGHQAEAVSAYRKASRKADNDVERSEYSAKALAMEDKLEEAETQLRRLLAIAPKRSSARSLLGRVLSERGMIEEAAQQLAQAVEDEPSALQQMTTVKRMTEADRPLLDRMRILAERPGLDVMSRTFIHFGLGKAFEDLGDYAEAMRHYEEGNRLRAMSARLDRRASVVRYDNIISRFTANSLAHVANRWRTGRIGRRPAGVHLGDPRSGSTLVEQICPPTPPWRPAASSLWQDRFQGLAACRASTPSRPGRWSRLPGFTLGCAQSGLGAASDRQVALQLRAALAAEARSPGRADDSLPPKPDRQLPRDLLHQLLPTS